MDSQVYLYQPLMTQLGIFESVITQVYMSLCQVFWIRGLPNQVPFYVRCRSRFRFLRKLPGNDWFPKGYQRSQIWEWIIQQSIYLFTPLLFPIWQFPRWQQTMHMRDNWFLSLKSHCFGGGRKPIFCEPY